MVIYLVHEFRLRARAANVQTGEQSFQICYGALPIHPQTTTCLPEQSFNLTLHTRCNHATPFEMLLGLCKLLQTAVSKPLLNCLNMFGISSAKGSKGNRTDVLHFKMVGLFPQPLAQHRRGSNLHNPQVLSTFFSQWLFGTHELTTKLHNKVIQKSGAALQLQLTATLECRRVGVVLWLAQPPQSHLCQTTIRAEPKVIVPIGARMILLVLQCTNNAGPCF